ncbi:Kelch repeat-containing proteins [Plasmopara halstedii]|uniref:receptor protein-tyrosine kinase n=1 Tax=Plasmopara halstedii TaxID=4781 RepID=A0A0P1A9V5_PLAHL|nr:Kelch repeat-containing proteins [Plasmopara halstedii]CEG37590.1 Kelch repeat-containing proteins [Plasmopara halstedii]|eukprot:XP_024573959.1 Kelch repeat-containing proteins [Plasmopara halstedii]
MRWISGWVLCTLLINVQSQRAQQDRRVYAQVVRLVPGNPGVADALVTWTSFDNMFEANGGDSLTGLTIQPGTQMTSQSPKQRVYTRADAGETINNGAFRLMLNGIVTPWIPFDATVDIMKLALESLEQILAVQVLRHELDTPGSFEWIIIFEHVRYNSEEPLPLLKLYTETMTAQWTGSGDQVAIEYLRKSPSFPEKNRRMCSDVCNLEVSELQTGTTLSFRVRALFSYDIGWTAWSTSTKVLKIPATRLPRAPSAPTLLAASSTQLTISWRMFRDVNIDNDVLTTRLFPVTNFQVQQQCDSEIGWTNISERVKPHFRDSSATFSTVAASLRRAPGSTCVFRVAAINDNGIGPYSMSSTPFTTLRTAPGAVLNLRLLRNPLIVVWEAPNDLGGHPVEILAYDVEYRTTLSSTWIRLAPEFVDSIQNVANVSKVSLIGYTMYVVRVRAIAEHQAGPFTQPVKFLTDYTINEIISSSSINNTIGIRYKVLPAIRQQSANNQDQYYIHLTGNGGMGGSQAHDGDHGLVLVFPVTWTGERLAERSFFFSGGIQTYKVQSEAQYVTYRIIALDIYAWGAGGAGSRSLNRVSSDLSNGGGGAFVRGLFRVDAGDVVDIIVGGGGHEDGRGGFHGGGSGGTGDISGGGGGGASEVRIRGRTILVAAGGGGAGSTDYCCAHGGGGGDLNEAESGHHPDASTIPFNNEMTDQRGRDEYRALNVAGDNQDLAKLSARHQHLDWGFAASSANYSVLATGGKGATLTAAGVAGSGGSFVYSLEGKCYINPKTSLMEILVSPLSAARWPSNGQRARGGSGQSGKQAGGGGGGGFFGGGGGGAGIDGAGGGGGSSFISFKNLFNTSKSGLSDASLQPQDAEEGVRQFRVSPLTSTSIILSWKAPRYGFSQRVDGFVIEMANGSVNEDFRTVRLITLPHPSFKEDIGNVTIHGLTPMASYRFQLKSLLLNGHDTYSDVITVRMPSKPTNRWQRCKSRSPDKETSRAEIRSSPLLRFPSARRGHSLTYMENSLYLFGGMAKSYECNQAHKVPCLLQQPEGVSNELWRYDLVTETWTLVPQSELVPPPREKHSMAVVKDRFLLFGGRQNDAQDTNNTLFHGPRALNDLWELSISSTTAKETAVSFDSFPLTEISIPDGMEVTAPGSLNASTSGEQLCIANMSVTVKLTHTCPHTLRLQLFGPRSTTFSRQQANFQDSISSQTRESIWSEKEGLKYTQRDIRTTGTVFSSRAFPVLLRSPEQAAEHLPCIPKTETLHFVSIPDRLPTSILPLETLSVFHQLPVAGNWTLLVTDTVADGFVGSLNSFDVQFDVTPCVPTFTWTNLSLIATGNVPTARYQHSVVVFENSMFVFGGIADDTGLELNDLYRFDYTPSSAFGVPLTAKWTQLGSLTDRESPSIGERRYHTGRTILLTPYEIINVGSGLKSPRSMLLNPDKNSRFEPQVKARWKRLEDMIDGWRILPTTSQDDMDENRPVPRYWDSSVFVYSLPGNIYVFGGQDDTTLLNDLWRLELAQLDEEFSKDKLKNYRLGVCAWRQRSFKYKTQWSKSCGANSIATAVKKCTLEMLLLYAWCEENYQSILL